METALKFSQWYLLITAINTVIVLIWFWHLSVIAHKEMKSIKTLVVIAFLPAYLALPLSLLALIAALICPDQGYWTNYKYYLVATIYSKKEAETLYGERTLKAQSFFAKRFVRFRQ